jgi:hypothetical protein
MTAMVGDVSRALAQPKAVWQGSRRFCRRIAPELAPTGVVATAAEGPLP